MANVRILIADDHAAIRAVLTRTLQGEPGIEVVGEAPDGYCAVLLAGKLKPDVILMDMVMPGLNGIDATRFITRQYPGIQVIGLSVHCLMSCARRMLEAGARAYVLKDGDTDDLLQAIEAVGEGRTYVSLEVGEFGREPSTWRMTRQFSHVG